MTAPEQPTVERIRAIAADFFATRGFAATTVRDIAAAGGLTPGAIYNHFESKVDILQAIVVGEYTALHAELRTGVEAAADPAHGLSAVTRAICRRAIDNAATAGTAEREYHHLTGRHREQAAGLREAILVLVEDVLRRGVDAGVFDLPGGSADVRRVGTSLVNMLVALSDAHSSVDPSRRDEVTDLHVKLVLRSVGSETG